MLPTFVSSGSSRLPTWMTKVNSARNTMRAKQKFDYFYVLDFEATCQEGPIPISPQEIIEIPVLAVNARTFAIEDTFHHYVKPLAHPTLKRFCVELTGIPQELVDSSSPFIPVFKELKAFIESRENFTFVTCGDWDLKTMLVSQCEYSRLEIPPYMRKWINIKKSYNRSLGFYPRKLSDMLHGIGLHFEGRPHSGIDDALNIHRVLQHLGTERGFVFENTFILRQ